jgi:hypothetical protein
LTVVKAPTSDAPQDFRLETLPPPDVEASPCGQLFQPEIRASNLRQQALQFDLLTMNVSTPAG